MSALKAGVKGTRIHIYKAGLNKLQFGSEFLGSLLCVLFSGPYLNVESLWWVLKRVINHEESPKIEGLEKTSDINSTLQQNTFQWLRITLRTTSNADHIGSNPPPVLHLPPCSIIQSQSLCCYTDFTNAVCLSEMLFHLIPSTYFSGQLLLILLSQSKLYYL